MPSVQLYSASAGSGKTFTLVREYLAILFRKADKGYFHAFRHILAITFTNKATEEMKRRVLSALKEISRDSGSNLQKALEEQLPRQTRLPEMADSILKAILRDYSSFNIQTIDSFFQDIIRSMARELRLPLNFDVEMNLDDAREYAVDELISRIGFEAGLTEWLRDYAFARIDDEKGWNFRAQLIEISRELEDDKLDREGLRDTVENIGSISGQLSRIISVWETALSEAASKLWEEMLRLDVPMDAYHRSWTPNVKRSMDRGRGFGSLATFNGLLSGEQSPITKTAQKKYKLPEDACGTPAFREHSAELHRLLTEDMLLYNAAVEARKNIYALGVIHQLNEYLIRYRKENNVIFIMDAARLISGFIKLEEMPFLFEKIGSRIEYLFIDEFQDTSATQWTNMLPLLQNILAASGSQTTIMLVGDAKQAIYRWRGGDYRLITGSAAASLQPFETQTVELEVNYRSLPEIVAFNNRIFSSIVELAERMAPPALLEQLQRTYSNVGQSAVKTGAPGRIVVRCSDPGDDEDHWKDAALRMMDEDIRSLRESGYEYHDIAILVRRRKDGVEISRHLQEAGIEVLSAETLLLKFDPQVRLIIAALSFINDPATALNYTNLVWQYSRWDPKAAEGLSESDILGDHSRRSLLGKWHPEILELSAAQYQPDSYQLFERVCSHLGIEATANLFTAHLRQVLFDHCLNQSSSLRDFLDWWEANKDDLSVNLENGRGRINIMTIHKAKGLEFPAVLIPYCDWNIYEGMHKDLLWLSDPAIADGHQLPYPAVKQLGESIFGAAFEQERQERWIDSVNLLYVALTRAQEYLSFTLPVFKPSREPKELPSAASKLLHLVLEGWNVPSETDGVLYASGELRRPPSGSAEGITEEDQLVFEASSVKGRSEHLPLRSSYEDRETRVGKLVHDSLYFSGPSSPADALKRASGKSRNSPAEIAEAVSHLERISRSSDFNEWVANALQTWNEQDLWHEGRVYRPDKIIRTKDSRMIVVDYKTGGHQEKYHNQVRKYMEAIRAVHPDHGVEGYILYTKDGLLEEVLP